MKREDLKALGLEDEAIDKIMTLHGKSVEAEKAKTSKASDELKAKTAELEAINAKLAELQTANADSEKVKAELAALKADIADKEAKAKEQAELDKMYAELDGYMPDGMQYMNEYAKNGVRSEAVKMFRENPTKGLKSCYESLIKDEQGNYKDGIFANKVQPAELPKMGNGIVTNETLSEDSLRTVMGLSSANKG